MNKANDKPGLKPRNIRSRNRKTILDLYHKQDELSVSEISKIAGLSRTTVTKVLQGLMQDGLILESGKRENTDSGGKKPNIFKFNSRKKLIITIYIQYENISLCIYDLKFNELINDSEEIIKTFEFEEVVSKLQIMIKRNVYEHPDFAEKDFLACIVGLHANIDQDTGLCLQATHFHSWGRNRNIRDNLNEQLGLSCPVYIDNWIRLKTFGENRLGEAGKYKSALLLDAGWHGVGVGILQNGEVYTGNHYLAGEIGHFKINPDDKEKCFCGSSGCFEQQIMIERLRRNAGRLSAEYPDSVLAENAGKVDYPVLFQAADAGDVIACKIIDSVVHWFTLVISYLLLFFDPEILYIEGDYASGCKYFEKGIEGEIQGKTMPRLERRAEIKYNRSGKESVHLGAAVFAFEHYFKSESDGVKS